MKVRIKFSKEGYLKFIGHLDTMRYFQKALRRAGLPVAYSEGFSPHIIMSFASPLGVGVTSSGEYFDVQFTEEVSTDEIERRLNETMVEGIQILCARKVEDGKASKAMSLVEAADYEITFCGEQRPEEWWSEKICSFLAQKEIPVTKKTKRNEKSVDLRPNIHEMRLSNQGIFMRLSAASRNYTKPELVLENFFAYADISPEQYPYQIHRCELYADLAREENLHRFVPLADLGERIE